MLTIKQLADYVGVTPRAVRHYHRLGLLPEPARSPAGYRLYTADDLLRLQRIHVLSEAGMPLARVAELLDAGPEALAATAAEVDAQLRRRIADLQQARRRLGMLLSREDPFLDSPHADRCVALLRSMAEKGLSDTTITIQKQGWMLIQMLYPELLENLLTYQERALADPAYLAVYLELEEARSWDPDDPRLEDLARRYAEASAPHAYPDDPVHLATDRTAHQVMATFQPESSPALIALNRRVDQILENLLSQRAGAFRAG